jgi:GntR family histidine utilization transcriptional repressor
MSANAPARRAAAPRYLEIQRTLRESIVSGDWPPGRKLPSEPELAEHFGCARMTVGRAIAALVEAGLLVRRRRAGTFVATPRVEETVLEIHDIAAEVRATGRLYAFTPKVRRVRRAGAADAERLNARVGAPVLYILGVHRASGAPFALEERLINLEAVPQARTQDFAETPPGSWLLGEVPWTEAEHQIEAVNADPVAEDLLALPPSTACLCVERRTWRGDESVTWVRLTFPGDQHRLVGRFRAQAVVRRLPI